MELYLAAGRAGPGVGGQLFNAGTGRSAEKLAHLETLAREKKLPLDTLEMDVCDDESVRCGVASVRSKAGDIDVLINNAGFAFSIAFEDLRLQDWRRQFETNVFGLIRVTQAVQNEVVARLPIDTHQHFSDERIRMLADQLLSDAL